MTDIKKGVYNFNYGVAEASRDVPLIGGALLGAQKLMCDWVYDPLTFGGDHVGCIAVDDVYHGLPNRTKEPVGQQPERG